MCRVHPGNPDLVYLAVLGNIFGPSEERGVYRSRDGGKTWDRVLYINDATGVVDVAMDPGNPRILYAAAWTLRRQPWSIDSGSKDGGLFKSTDGGDTWKKLEGGLPTDVLVGKIGVTVSPANPDRVWAQVEAADHKGGVYRSDDAGRTWQRVNTTRALQQRAWYYTHVVADPQNADTVYALNVNFHKSTDGGRTFQTVQVPHGDNHDLWINPTNNKVMVYADDGGAGVSLEARAKLASANTAVQEEQMVAAAQLAEQSRVEAELAAAKTASVKARMVNDEMMRSTGTLIDEMQRNSGDPK